MGGWGRALKSLWKSLIQFETHRESEWDSQRGKGDRKDKKERKISSDVIFQRTEDLETRNCFWVVHSLVKSVRMGLYVPVCMCMCVCVWQYTCYLFSIGKILSYSFFRCCCCAAFHLACIAIYNRFTLILNSLNWNLPKKINIFIYTYANVYACATISFLYVLIYILAVIFINILYLFIHTANALANININHSPRWTSLLSLKSNKLISFLFYYFILLYSLSIRI